VARRLGRRHLTLSPESTAHLCAVSAVPVARPSLASRWQSFEAWVGTRTSGVALFALALVTFGIRSLVVPVHPGRDFPRYIQSYVQIAHDYLVLPVVVNTRGPLSALGVSVPLEIGGWAAGIWLALLYAASIVAWGVAALHFGPRAAIVTTVLLLVYPGYGILFHGLASDALFAAAFAGWALVMARAIMRPSIVAFGAAGLGMGLLALVRPGNQALIAISLVPLLVRAPWSRRLQWVASFFIASVVVTQGWRALATWRFGDAVGLRPSTAVLLTAVALCALFLPGVWRRRAALVAVPVLVVVVAVVAIRGLPNPVEFARTLAQTPSSSVFLFRVFEMDRIVEPENGPASGELARVVARDLLTEEPYRSYGIDLDEFFSSGSDRMFVDLNTLGGETDLKAVTDEAIRAHPGAFAKGIASTIWAQLWARRVYAPESTSGGAAAEPEQPPVVVDGKALPRPSEGEPIPTSRAGPNYLNDTVLQRRLERDTLDVEERLPNRDGTELAHRLNQASRAFPPIVVWLALGLVALAARRPRGALVPLALATAALLVILATAFVTIAVAEYAVPVSPAFILLAVVGLVGAHPRSPLRIPGRTRK
jgi:hypothetical protein